MCAKTVKWTETQKGTSHSWLRSAAISPPKTRMRIFHCFTSIHDRNRGESFLGNIIYCSFASSVCCSGGCKSADWSNCRAKGIQSLISELELSKVEDSHGVSDGGYLSTSILPTLKHKYTQCTYCCNFCLSNTHVYPHIYLRFSCLPETWV